MKKIKRGKEKTLKQSAKLSQAQSYPTLLQSKVYKYLLWNALPTLRQGSIHYVRVQELRRALNVHDGQDLKEKVEALATIKINWESVGKSHVKWGWSSLLSGCRLLEDNRVEYSFDPILVSELYMPKQFRIYNLDVILGFNSHYALKIYEMAYQYYDAKEEWGRTPSMTRDRLRELFNVAEHEYARPFDFIRKAIISPLQEVNQRADIDVTFHQDNGKPRARLYWFEAKRRSQQQFNFLEHALPPGSSENPDRDAAFLRFMGTAKHVQKSIEGEFFKAHPGQRGAYRRGARHEGFEEYLLKTYPSLLTEDARPQGKLSDAIKPRLSPSRTDGPHHSTASPTCSTA